MDTVPVVVRSSQEKRHSPVNHAGLQLSTYAVLHRFLCDVCCSVLAQFSSTHHSLVWGFCLIIQLALHKKKSYGGLSACLYFCSITCAHAALLLPLMRWLA